MVFLGCILPLFGILFSSPKPKAQVGFSDRLSSVVCLCICLSVNFSHFNLLQNHWADFNQTWHIASLCGGNSSLFKWRDKPFSNRDNHQIVKVNWQNFKISLSRTNVIISTNLGTEHPWMIRLHVFSKVGPRPFTKGDTYDIAKIHWQLFKIVFSRITRPILTNNLIFKGEIKRVFPKST